VATHTSRSRGRNSRESASATSARSTTRPASDAADGGRRRRSPRGGRLTGNRLDWRAWPWSGAEPGRSHVEDGPDAPHPDPRTGPSQQRSRSGKPGLRVTYDARAIPRPVLRTTRASLPTHNLPDHIQHDARGARIEAGRRTLAPLIGSRCRHVVGRWLSLRIYVSARSTEVGFSGALRPPAPSLVKARRLDLDGCPVPQVLK
jgi:hypothetical protein